MSMTGKKYAVGIDLGGTSIKYALIDEDGEFRSAGKLPSMADISAEAVIGQILKAVSESEKAVEGLCLDGIAGIGIGTPGIVENGTVIGGAENIVGWKDVELARIIREKTGYEVTVENDANMMGLGETLYGAGKGASDVIFITVGTGIGGAVVIGGRLFTGYRGRGTELGHVPILADGEQCACGSRGCLEHYASASALVRSYVERLSGREDGNCHEQIDGRHIMDLCRKGDPLALECLNRHCELLGQGIAGFINIFSPQLVVIGGGLADAGEFYISRVREKAFLHAMPECAVNTEIRGAVLGNRAGCAGAAATVFQSLSDRPERQTDRS